MVCKTKDNETLDEEKGKYILDPQKLRVITEPYLAGLGIISQIEKYVNEYEQKIQGSLRVTHVALYHFDEEDVKLVLDIPKQKEELRTLLIKATDGQIEKVFTKYLYQKQSEIIGSEIKHQDLAAMSVPQNSNQRRFSISFQGSSNNNSKQDKHDKPRRISLY